MITPYDETGAPQSATLTSYYPSTSSGHRFGGAYEVTGSSVRKYYSFGGETILRDSTGLQYFLTDHLGSVVAITDSNGTLTSQQRYLPFGAERTNIGVITQTDLGYTGQRDLGMGLMDYHARFYSPYLNRFIQPDSLIPDPVNPQAWNRYSYVGNRPVNFNDPSGHCEVTGEDDSDNCHAPSKKLTNKTIGGGGSGGDSSGDDENQDSGHELKKDNCSYHLCTEDTSLYEIGWENFGQAWNIWNNPNASYGQKWFAGAYMSYWGGAHVCLIICAGVAAAEYLVPGSITCMMSLKCADAIFWSGGDAAKAAAEKFAKSINGVTLEQTVPGRVLDYITKKTSYNLTKSAWDFLSQKFASGASGPANAFLHYPELNPSGVLMRIELEALKWNSAVPLINIYSVP